MNIEAMRPISELIDDPNDENCLYRFAQVAQSFLLSHRWCQSIKTGYIGYGLDGILGVFFFEILPSRPDVDSQLWVVTGDIPPAYLVCDDAPCPSKALEGYIYEMQRWVDAVKVGQSVDELIPVCYQ